MRKCLLFLLVISCSKSGLADVEIPYNSNRNNIIVPDYDYSIFTKQYILPVIFVTKDSFVPDTDEIVNLYERGIFDESFYTEPEFDLLRATVNISQGLRLAQEKYKRMFKSTYREQGTFDIASFSFRKQSIEVFRQEEPVEAIIKPVIINGERTSKEYWELSHPNGERGSDGENYILGEVYNALNCSRYNCPFIPIIFYAAPNGDPIHSVNKDYCYFLYIPAGTSGGGSKWNRGYNTGGGAVILPYASAINANNSESGYYTKNRFLSILAHEIGHTFGLFDMKTSTAKYYSSYSIMSYDTKNWQGGCWNWIDARSGFCYLNPDYLNLSDDMYLYPDYYIGTGDITNLPVGVDRYPGLFGPYEKEVIGMYNSIFDLVILPEDQMCKLYTGANYTDCIEQNLKISPPLKDRRIPNQGEITITGTGTGNINKLFGAVAISFPPSGETQSVYRVNNGSSICIDFPINLEMINLKKIMVYTGITLNGEVINKATNIEIYNDGRLVNSLKEVSTNQNTFSLTFNEYFYSLCVKLFGDNDIDIRGIRLFSNEELFPPFEPKIFHELSGKDSGFIHKEHSIGTNRIIHNRDGGANVWSSDKNSAYVVIKFPRQTNLSKIIVYAGYKYKNYLMGVPNKILIEKFENSKWVECAAQYVYGNPESEVGLNCKGKLWKISFSPGWSGNIVVRGLRFFNDKEIFEPFQ